MAKQKIRFRVEVSNAPQFDSGAIKEIEDQSRPGFISTMYQSFSTFAPRSQAFSVDYRHEGVQVHAIVKKFETCASVTFMNDVEHGSDGAILSGHALGLAIMLTGVDPQVEAAIIGQLQIPDGLNLGSVRPLAFMRYGSGAQNFPIVKVAFDATAAAFFHLFDAIHPDPHMHRLMRFVGGISGGRVLPVVPKALEQEFVIAYVSDGSQQRYRLLEDGALHYVPEFGKYEFVGGSRDGEWIDLGRAVSIGERVPVSTRAAHSHGVPNAIVAREIYEFLVDGKVHFVGAEPKGTL